MSFSLAFTAAALFSIGTYLVLQRKLSRIIIGIGLLGHGVNILFLVSGDRGSAAIVGSGDSGGFSDPLPQSLVLTAIVITFGVTAFLLALGYRSWRITHDDVVEDDIEDRFIARRTKVDQLVEEQRQAEREQAAEEDRA